MVAPSEESVLPQHGFGLDTRFAILAKSNRFLFRVYTPRLRSPIESNRWNDVYFIAPKFDRMFDVCQDELSNAVLSPPLGWPEKAAYDDVVQYMDWTTRPSSPYISSSFSFAWAIWEAMRRYRQGVKHDVEIAIIDAFALRDRAVTAMELLDKCSSDQHQDHRTWRRYSAESQCVLIYGYVPVTCVFTSVPLLTIVSNLPSYFLSPELAPRIEGHNNRCLDNLLLGHRASYKQFCLTLGDRYKRLQPEIRLRDTAVGSVVLAISFLRNWLEQQVSSTKEDSITTTIALAWTMAKWPNQDDDALEDIRASIESMVRTIIDEIEVFRLQVNIQSNETSRLHGLIEELEQMIRQLENHASGYPATGAQFEWSTPSPSNTAVHSLPPSPLSLKLIIPSPTPTASPDPSPAASPTEYFKTPDSPDNLKLDFRPSTAIDGFTSSESLRSTDSKDSGCSEPTLGVSSCDDSLLSVISSSEEQSLETESSSFMADVGDCADRETETSHQEHRTVIVPEPLTVSYLVTGFLFGAFVALCVVSNQRRVLLNNLV